MRLYTRIVRLSILAGLVASSAVCGGWKWDVFPH
jgi:hypothetical protein